MINLIDRSSIPVLYAFGVAVKPESPPLSACSGMVKGKGGFNAKSFFLQGKVVNFGLFVVPMLVPAFVPSWAAQRRGI